jgi:hypothetical protein
LSSCVDDGFCSLEQTNLIQKNLEKKLRKLYLINETIGQSLLDDNDDEQTKERRSMLINDDNDPSHVPSNGTAIHRSNIDQNVSPVTDVADSNTKHKSTVSLSPSIRANLNHSPSSSDNRQSSPGEHPKARSPSSLSETSP